MLLYRGTTRSLGELGGMACLQNASSWQHPRTILDLYSFSGRAAEQAKASFNWGWSSWTRWGFRIPSNLQKQQMCWRMHSTSVCSHGIWSITSIHPTGLHGQRFNGNQWKVADLSLPILCLADSSEAFLMLYLADPWKQSYLAITSVDHEELAIFPLCHIIMSEIPRVPIAVTVFPIWHIQKLADERLLWRQGGVPACFAAAVFWGDTCQRSVQRQMRQLPSKGRPERGPWLAWAGKPPPEDPSLNSHAFIQMKPA